ncbi:3-hydroxyacyl-CoA dehydrogenase NAD-binding domain-containing protein [Photobacterium alginatilyticum]|uniref:enoyl-CoA hydratase n=1 Tax=Photobacterium alginatilyticum TaxID=1775171 RepID=A0ABW9YD54_9GAMM|nr:3-hydroxyacyl-CoA dehydrogenase NAD-binding domain-containing protein [Photobacterium alginatilyticum]NBI51231.1 multifunctional fatty acid oxidation complex subunit alpha [Photobacterium alginatilyticum]
MLFNGTHFILTKNENNIAVLDFISPARLMSKAVITELHSLLDGLALEENIKGLVVTSSSDNFAYGADINEFTPLFKGGAGDHLAYTHAAYNKLEDLPFPTITIIKGHCYGGGAEFALSTDFRIGTPTLSVGFPEVKIGILPGMGGTTRMPRLVGLDTSLSWLTSGRNFKADKALKDGFVNGIVDTEHSMAAAIDMINECTDGKRDYQVVRAAKTGKLPLSAYELQMSIAIAKGMIGKAAGPNYPAPMTIVDIIEQSAKLTREDALKNEITGVVERLINTGHSAAMCHVYLADLGIKSKTKKLAGEKTTECAVIGAGIMGGGIAHTNATKGIRVPLKDINQAGLDLGLSTAVNLLEKPVKRGKLNFSKAATALNNIIPTLTNESLKNSDMVIEAVVEDPKVKSIVLKQCEDAAMDNAIIASNTSTISITQLAKSLTRPENFIGIHFFNPVNKMPLVEVIRGKQTSEETVKRAVAYVQQIGKTPIVINDCAGFFVNRILTPYMRAYSNLLAKGADFVFVEKTMKKYGMPMGPAELIDVVGLDTSAHVLELMSQNYSHMPLPENNIVQALVENSLLGQKNGEGFYTWSTDRRGRPVKTLNNKAMELIKPTGKLELTEEEIINALLLPMMFEAKRALNEGIIASEEDADLAMIYGTGFPPFRGGLVYEMNKKEPGQIEQEANDIATLLADEITYTVPEIRA